MSTNVKILGLSFSPRHSNTEIILRESLMAAEELPGVETDYYDIVGKTIYPCDSCYRCFTSATMKKCCPAYDDDCFEEIVQKIYQADGIIFACPVYYMGVTAQMKAFMDRSMGVEALGYAWRNKVAGFVTVAFDRNGGQEHTLREMQTWAFMHDMIPLSVGPERAANGIGSYLGAAGCQGFPYPHSSSKPGSAEAVRQDDVGMYAAKCVGWRTAEMAKIMKVGYENIAREDLKWHKGAIGLDMVDQWS